MITWGCRVRTCEVELSHVCARSYPILEGRALCAATDVHLLLALIGLLPDTRFPRQRPRDRLLSFNLQAHLASPGMNPWASSLPAEKMSSTASAPALSCRLYGLDSCVPISLLISHNLTARQYGKGKGKERELEHGHTVSESYIPQQTPAEVLSGPPKSVRLHHARSVPLPTKTHFSGAQSAPSSPLVQRTDMPPPPVPPSRSAPSNNKENGASPRKQTDTATYVHSMALGDQAHHKAA